MATARAKATKSSPYQPFIEALNKKQHELLDSYERDKAASAYSKELNFSLSDGERNLLMLIEEAFNRIREGTFAVCTNCSNQIGEKRLTAVPWTPYCIDCQELQEKGLLA